MMNTILVAGGTGKVGEKIVKALVKRGANVRAIVRSGTESQKQEKLAAILLDRSIKIPQYRYRGCERIRVKTGKIDF